MIKKVKALMGTTVTVEIVDEIASKSDIEKVFLYFESIEKQFSIFKRDSEISLINDGRLEENKWSKDMKIIFDLTEKTKKETYGYFNILTHEGLYDPSGIVKGWAVYNAYKALASKGFKNFYVDAGGDIQVCGKNENYLLWSVGIKNPFNQDQIIKIVYLKDRGIATSGTYIRGQHIYDPFEKNSPLSEIVSTSIIGPNIYEADRFATAAFAMGKQGINFIESLDGFEGYIIDKDGVFTETSGFEKYTACIKDNGYL